MHEDNNPIARFQDGSWFELIGLRYLTWRSESKGDLHPLAIRLPRPRLGIILSCLVNSNPLKLYENSMATSLVDIDEKTSIGSSHAMGTNAWLGA